MNGRRSKWQLAGAVLLAAFLVACGAPAATPTPEPPTPTVFPTGKFTMTDRDGTWVIEFKEDGSFGLTVNDTPMVGRGTYTIVQDQITFSDDSAPCVGKGDGVYLWAFDGQVLTWKAVEDQCAARKGTQHASKWTKQP